MSSDLLNVGSLSVLTAQRQLNTTGHNIANANTEGYSRQQVLQGTEMPRQFGGQNYGMGVHVEKVRRLWDQFAVKELNLATSDFNQKQDTEGNLDTLSKLLSSSASKKVPENINNWFDSVKTLADTPNNIGARKVVIENANLIAQNLNDLHQVVYRQFQDSNRSLELGVERVNQIAVELRDIQRLMMRNPGPHNDLMDQHEKLVKELSEYTKVTVTPRRNAEGFNIHIGSGHTLVSGTEASTLALVPGYPDAKQKRLAMVEGTGIKAITMDDIGGKIQSMLQMRDENIPFVLDQLGMLATGLAFNVNKLQAQGLDINGDIGENLFNDVNSEQEAKERVITKSDSQADISVYIEDMTPVQGGQYSVFYDGSDYIVTRPDGTQVTPDMRGGAFTIDGMRVEVNEDADDGERFFIRPTRAGAANLQMATIDPEKIAAQSFEASTSFAQGVATFKITKAGELREFEVDISDDGLTFSVSDSKGHVVAKEKAYPPGKPVTVMGTTFELSAGALPKDKFTANLVPSEGDNGNLRKLQDLQTEKGYNNERTSLIGLYQDLNTNMGLKIATSSRLTDVARLEKEAAEQRIASISGVNLDEEAANMMKFQQAYMASSRIMQAANDTFNTILQLR